MDLALNLIAVFWTRKPVSVHLASLYPLMSFLLLSWWVSQRCLTVKPNSMIIGAFSVCR
jgi:hypothetical protein